MTVMTFMKSVIIFYTEEVVFRNVCLYIYVNAHEIEMP